MKKYLILFFILILCKCNSNHDLASVDTEVIDTLSIPITEKALAFYHHIDYDPKHNILVGYNRFSHSIQFFDLFNQKFLRSINLEKDGPSGVRTVGETKIKNDKIYLSATPEWIVMDLQGNILHKSYPEGFINDFYEDYYFNSGLRISQLQRSSLDNTGSFIYATVEPKVIDITDNDRYSHPAVAKLFIEKDSVSIIPDIKYPDVFQQQTSFGVLDKPTVTEYDDLLIVTYANHNGIYVYDLKNNQVTEYFPESDLISNVIDVNQNGGLREILQSSIIADRYYPLTYDPYQQLFYRLIRTKNDVTNENEYHLLVFDESFNILKTLNLDKEKVYAPGYLPTPMGLLIQTKGASPDETVFQYVLITFNSED